jgi:phage terminase Nu1 subunit (DNA packaging protein)
MGEATTPRLMTKSEFAKHRNVSKPYISKLARNGILVMRGGKIDVVATDQVLDDKPLPEIEQPPPIRTPPPRAPDAVRMEQMPARGGNDRDRKTTYAEARTIRTVFQAKLARLDFETKQGKLIEAAGVRMRISEHVRAFRDGMLGLPDRLASTLAAETDQRKVHVMLKTEITRELEALARGVGGV